MVKPTLKEVRKRFPIGTKLWLSYFGKSGDGKCIAERDNIWFDIETIKFDMISNDYIWAITKNEARSGGGTLNNYMRVVWDKDTGWARFKKEHKLYELWK